MPRRHFTLIEMLVVIAIIAILASLLAPSLRRSLRVANSLSCLNNLRQIGVWALGYATEWNGYLPIHGTATGTDTSVYNYAYDWVTVMKDEKLFNGKDLSTGAGMTCRELYAAHGARATTWTANSYGLNRYMGGRIVKDAKGNPLPAARERLLSGRAFWFADGAIYKHKSGLDVKPDLTFNHYNFGPGGCPKDDQGRPDGPWCWGAPDLTDEFGDPVNPGAGHTGGMDCNFVFGDGHTKSVGYFEFYRNGNTSDKETKLWRNQFLFGRDY